MKDASEEAFTYRGCATENGHPNKGRLNADRQVVDYLLGTYATDNLIADVESETTNFEHPEHICAV